MLEGVLTALFRRASDAQITSQLAPTKPAETLLPGNNDLAAPLLPGNAHLADLPDEVLLLVLSFCDLPTLYQLPALSTTMQHLSTNDEIWRKRLESTFSLIDQRKDPLCSARTWCRRAAHGEPFDVQHLNSRTVPGTFASACYTSAYYNDQSGQSVSVRLDERSRVDLPPTRLRPCSGDAAFAPLESFAALVPGMVVELQWKKSARSPKFSHWYALVDSVLSDEEVRIYFPQYGNREIHLNSSIATGPGSELTGTCVLQRTRETPMHGGFAGGMRLPSRREVEQWWAVLATSEHDRLASSHESPPSAASEQRSRAADGPVLVGSVDGIRKRFLTYLPRAQPELSLRLAGCPAEEAAPLIEAVAAAAREAASTVPA